MKVRPWLLAALPLGMVLGVECTTRGTSPAPPASATPASSEVEAPSAAPRASSPDPTPVSDAELRTEDERNTIDVFQQVAPATVFVTQRSVRVDPFGLAEVAEGSGSGFIWDAQGHVVTNAHVVHRARTLTVTLHDQSKYPAEIVGVEPYKDIAVLKLIGAPPNLTPIVVAKNHKLQVGQKTLAIGNPFGLDHTLTTGVVSALGREVPGQGGVKIRDMIQTDATINPGNSGGPLLNSKGELIGMNTAIFSPSGGSAGIGFAVPGSTIGRVVPQIIATGRAEQVGLGVRIDPYQRLERRLGIQGVVILSVTPKTPAAVAGLRGIEEGASRIRLGDIIVGVDQEPVHDYDDLYTILDKHAAGDGVQIKVRRDRELLTVEVKLIRIQ